MTSLEQCFMLEKSLRLTFQTMLAVYKSGFTRVPVFEGDRQNIVAVMYAKDLILVDPDDSIQVGTVLSFRSVFFKQLFCVDFFKLGRHRQIPKRLIEEMLSR